MSYLAAKLCPHCNVWPEIVLQELHCLLNCVCVFLIRFSTTSPSFIALHLPVLRELNVLPEALYCLKEQHYVYFIIVVCSLKSIHIPNFVLIGCLYCHTCRYRNVWPEAVIVVLQELHCLPNCLHVLMIRVRGCYHFTKFCYCIPYGF